MMTSISANTTVIVNLISRERKGAAVVLEPNVFGKLTSVFSSVM